MGAYPTSVDSFDLTFVQHSHPLPDSSFVARSLMSFSQGIYASTLHYSMQDCVDFQKVLTLSDESKWYFGHEHTQIAQPVSGSLQVANQAMLLDACLMGLGPAKLLDNQVESFVRNGRF